MNVSRKPVVVIICVGVGLLHFLVGPDYNGPFRLFVTGYLIDILLPFSLVLLSGMGLEKVPVLRHPLVRGIFVMSIGITVEILQFFGYHVFGATYDPLDFLMYGLGVVTGLFFERVAFGSTPIIDMGQPVAGGDRTRCRS